MDKPSIDWNVIHNRIAAFAGSADRGFEPGPEETRRILQARARKAAQPPEGPDLTERLEVLGFTLGSETYGVETCHVREVCELRDLTPIPCTPEFVAGLMNLRSQVLTVVDLRKFFDLPVRGLSELNRVIVLSSDDGEFGLLADSIEGLRSVTVAELQEGLPTLTGVRERFLKGVTGRMLAVLDGARLLADASLKVNELVTGRMS